MLVNYESLTPMLPLTSINAFFYFLSYFIMEITITRFGISHSQVFSGTEITDFEMSDKTFNTIKYAPDILKIHRTSCIMAIFDMHKYSFSGINTYCVNKPCIFFFYFFFIPSTAKILIKQKENKFKYINIIDKKKRR